MNDICRDINFFFFANQNFLLHIHFANCGELLLYFSVYKLISWVSPVRIQNWNQVIYSDYKGDPSY